MTCRWQCGTSAARSSGALCDAGWCSTRRNVSAAARRLGISRNTLYRKIGRMK
ncbi:MAG: helix-turn-helix domain-containing protein [Azoarcus sp.]|nr:helix-turn-helix domain-containing protein [Azoarcus sp.]